MRQELAGLVEPITGAGSALIARVTLYLAALGGAISQACYATGENHGRAVLRQLLGELVLEGVLIQSDACIPRSGFSTPPGAESRRPADSHRRSLLRRSSEPRDAASSDPQLISGKTPAPFVARDHKISHSRDITWTLRATQAPEHISESWISTSP